MPMCTRASGWRCSTPSSSRCVSSSGCNDCSATARDCHAGRSCCNTVIAPSYQATNNAKPPTRPFLFFTPVYFRFFSYLRFLSFPPFSLPQLSFYLLLFFFFFFFLFFFFFF